MLTWWVCAGCGEHVLGEHCPHGMPERPSVKAAGDPRVSIIIVNWMNPSIVNVCLHSLTITEDVPYEVVVVDNGSDEATVHALERHRDEGRITTLYLNPTNEFFSRANNLGFQHSNPAAEMVLLMNSDVAVIRPDWLTKLVAWMDGTEVTWPNVWGTSPTRPKPGPRDIVSAGFSWDPQVKPSNMRPEGFCCLIRREWWRDLDVNHPWHGGFEHALADSIRAGARCGVLSQYPPLLVHREGGSAPGTWSCEAAAAVDRGPKGFIDVGPTDIPGWFAGLEVEALDLTLGIDEHASYALF